MQKEHEDYLWERIPCADQMREYPPVRETIDSMVKSGMIKNPKQAWRTLEKWCSKGLYNYGSTLDIGWKEKME